MVYSKVDKNLTNPGGRAPETSVCDRSITGIMSSNPAAGHGCSSLVFVVCCLGSGLCVGLITRSEVSYRMCVCCVCPIVCD